jgi:hypothetical protein
MKSHGPGGLPASLVAIAATLAMLAMTSTAFAAAPANDNVANAQVLSAALPTTVSGTNLGATAESGEPNRTDSLMRPASTVWYVWTAPASPSETTIDVCQADYHVVLGLYEKIANPVPPFSNLDEWGVIGDGPGHTSGCTDEYGAAGVLTPDAGATYYIQISGFLAPDSPDGDRGPFSMTVSAAGTSPSQTPTSPGPTPPTTTKKKKCKRSAEATIAKKKKKKCKK